MQNPKIRAVQAFPVEHEGKQMVGIRDASGLVDQVIVVPQPVLFMMSLMDGTNSILDIQVECTRQFEQIVPAEAIRRVVEQLDEALLIEGERFDAFQDGLIREFRELPVRPSSHAGSAYPEDPAELRGLIDGFFVHPDASGPAEVPSRPIRALLAPHIDFERGAAGYAHAYRALAQVSDAELFVILGVCHQPMDTLHAVTRKDYETPFGKLRTDGDFIDLLTENCGIDLTLEEFAHRSEHSVEFQAVMLQHMANGNREISAVPILCGSLHQLMLDDESPGEFEPLQEFITALRKSLDECGKKWCLVGGVDLAHVGAYFGDERSLDEDFLREVEQADRTMLRYIEAVDPEGFYDSIRSEMDRRRVCGIPAIYTILKTLAPGEGQVLDYRQCVTLEAQNCVTITSAVIY